MFLSSWWRNLSNRNTTSTIQTRRRGKRAKAPRVQPRIELLETRVVPTTVLSVTNNTPTGGGSLRQALIDANNITGEDTITFNLPLGNFVIQPAAATPFPTIVGNLVIDGKTQNGYVPSTDTSKAIQAVTLDGIVAGTVSGFTVGAVGRIIIDGIKIINFAGDGIRVTGTSPAVTQVSVTDNLLDTNNSDGLEAVNILRLTMRGIVAQNQVNGAGINVTSCSDTINDTNSFYVNNGENGMRLEDIGGNVTLRRVQAINNNFDQVFGTGSGFVAFDGPDSDLFAIRGNVLFRGCDFGTQPFSNEQKQRQVDGVRIIGVEGTVTFETVSGFNTQSNFNRGDGIHIEGAQDIADMDIFVTLGSFGNNGGDGIDINLTGAADGDVILNSIVASSNGESGLDMLAIPGAMTVVTATAVSTFNQNGQSFTGGDGITMTNVRNVSFSGGVPGSGIIADRNRDAGVEITTAISVSDTDGRFRGNGNSGIARRGH